MALSADVISPDVIDLARSARHITVLSGAGMSTESGIPTFRDPDNGLWAHANPAELATPEAWEGDPAYVWAWYRWRAVLMNRVEPNPGHVALAQWGARPGIQMTIGTQNIDNLHERAGSDSVHHLHGSIFQVHCSMCGVNVPDEQPLPTADVPRLEPPRCPECGGAVRPSVVWFGEVLPAEPFLAAQDAATSSDLVLLVGTSNSVYPAAQLPFDALNASVPVVEIGPFETEFTDFATHVVREKSGVALPELLAAVSGA